MYTKHWMAALTLATLSLTAGCAADASDKQGEGTSSLQGTSSTASANTVFEASAATRAATGIAYYAFDPSRNGKAFAADGSVIATFDVSSTAEKSVLRVGAYGRQIEIVYSIQDAVSVGVEGTVDGTPFNVSFSKDGSVTGDAPKNIDPAFDAILQGLGRDSMASIPSHHGLNTRIRPLMSAAYCGGLWDAIEGAQNAGEWLSVALLTSHYAAVC